MLDFYKKYGEWNIIPYNPSAYAEKQERNIKENKKALDKMEKDVKELIKQGVTIEIAKTLSSRLYITTKKKIEIVKKCKQYEANKGMLINL